MRFLRHVLFSVAFFTAIIQDSNSSTIFKRKILHDQEDCRDDHQQDIDLDEIGGRWILDEISFITRPCAMLEIERKNSTLLELRLLQAEDKSETAVTCQITRPGICTYEGSTDTRFVRVNPEKFMIMKFCEEFNNEFLLWIAVFIREHADLTMDDKDAINNVIISSGISLTDMQKIHYDRCEYNFK